MMSSLSQKYDFQNPLPVLNRRRARRLLNLCSDCIFVVDERLSICWWCYMEQYVFFRYT